MSFDLSPDELDDEHCGRPCDPAMHKSCCSDYWDRMKHEGYWIDGFGWTEKGGKEMCK